MPRWIAVAQVADCPPGTARELLVEDRVIALLHAEGQFFALDGICPHQGGPLGQGVLNGCILTCPWHGWQFDVRDGIHQITPRIVQPLYPVRVENGTILVDLASDADGPAAP